MSSTVSFEKLTLPVFLGTLGSWALFGVLAVQIGIYYLAFPKDPVSSKVLVASVALLEILTTIIGARDAVRIFGISWGNPQILDDVGWSWLSTPVVGSIIGALGQIFFAWRIHVISRGFWIPALIVAVSIVSMSGGICAGVKLSTARVFSGLPPGSNFKPTIIWLVASSLCDLIIGASMAFYLLRGRSGFGPTNARILQIVKLTVETGSICALLILIDLYLFVAYKNTSYHLGICDLLSKAYSNSILVILNSRAYIGHVPTTEICYVPSELIFSNSAMSRQVPIQLDRNTVASMPSIINNHEQKSEV
ncbi:hypothetical protein MSAN_01583700 [Mycena sanguinolenta]|uniref:DUF6534 domain-containing protein n=1 Tax=Mycena sanguinolenta TaxID=230812 RepID=A0A8H6Y022_9AGAR|nr:hypothetical protein MSAN_01583700 [Mycena sanguinolenta]